MDKTMGKSGIVDLAGRKILVGVTGGVSAYKSIYLTSLLVQSKAEVEVVLTRSASNFVGGASFQALTGRQVRTDIFDTFDKVKAEHISLAQWSDIFVIAPVTANTLAKLAMGSGDNLLTCTVLATKAPILLAPAMNQTMWENRFVQDNVHRLGDAGINFVGPEEGFLACGTKGAGRMSEPGKIYQAIITLLTQR